MIDTMTAIMSVADPDGILWYMNDQGKCVSGHPIQADESGVVFADLAVRSLGQVAVSEDSVLRLVK